MEGDILAPSARARLAEPPGGPNVAVSTPPAASGNVPTTSAAAKQIASQYYELNAAQGNRMLPGSFTNQLIEDFKQAAPKGALEKAVAGEGRIGQMAKDVEGLRDQPTTLEDAQRAYSRIGDAATAEFRQNGSSETYRSLTQIQGNMRDRISPPDLAGDDPWTLARKAWSQAMKLDDLERIQERADMTDNPATSIRTQIRTLVNNPSKIRGYSDDEVASLKAAAERGTMGSLFHVFGSRLVPLAAGAAEAGTHGLTLGTAAYLGGHAVSSYLRNKATSIATNKLQKAMGVVGESVPRDPLSPPPVLTSGNSLAAPLTAGAVNDLAAQYR